MSRMAFGGVDEEASELLATLARGGGRVASEEAIQFSLCAVEL